MGSLVNRTSYSAPNVNVDTSGPGMGGLGGLEVDPFFMNMAKRRAALAAQRATMENIAMKRSLGPQYRSDADPTQLQRAQEADAIDELGYKKALRAADLNPPKKLISGFNINPGYIEDTSMLPVSMRPKNAGFVPPEENTAGIDPKSKGTGGFDPVAAEDAARGGLGAPGGNLAGPTFDAGMLGMRAKLDAEAELEKKRQQAQAQQQYFSGRG
jgi:hypothetical protein